MFDEMLAEGNLSNVDVCIISTVGDFVGLFSQEIQVQTFPQEQLHKKMI